MQDLSLIRRTHEYTQHNPAPLERVFPLLCPVREQEWVPGWKYRLICSQSGLAELGCVFTTPEQDGSATTWICTEYDPPGRVAYCWVRPDMVACLLSFELERAADETTAMRVCYQYTALSAAGNAEVTRYDDAWFAAKMNGFESALNHYLRTGKRIGAAAWE